ncbi:MAG: phage tail protein I [Burkholderia gladioli]
MVDDIAPLTLLPPLLANDRSCRALESLTLSLAHIDLTPLVVYDFETVPASVLPSLAEQFRVMGDAGWDLAATETQQRSLLKEAVALHRIRGTPYAVTRILAILNIQASVAEWFEAQPPGDPYTFTIRADSLDQPPPLDAARWAQIARVVNFWKNACSAVSFALESSAISLGTGIAMVVAGSEAEQLDAVFERDAVALTLASTYVVTSTEYQSVGANFS